MADRTAPVIKLTLTLTLTGHNLAKTGTSPLKGPTMRQNLNNTYRAIFCTLKTTSDYISTSGCVIRPFNYQFLIGGGGRNFVRISRSFRDLTRDR